tara:strand:+ start:317 stop:580 length:264 start_codon:yes stop_codon:yes gene_type:complete
MPTLGNTMIFQIVGTIFRRFSRQQADNKEGYAREQVVDEIQLFCAVKKIDSFIIRHQTERWQPPHITSLMLLATGNRVANPQFKKNM